MKFAVDVERSRFPEESKIRTFCRVTCRTRLPLTATSISGCRMQRSVAKSQEESATPWSPSKERIIFCAWLSTVHNKETGRSG